MDFVFLGSNATRLSIQLLTDVAQGKGNQVDSEIVSDTHESFSLSKLFVLHWRVLPLLNTIHTIQ